MGMEFNRYSPWKRGARSVVFSHSALYAALSAAALFAIFGVWLLVEALIELN